MYKYNIDTTAEKLAPQFFFLQSTSESPLTFNERLVYSILAKCDFQGYSVRMVEIAKQCGLSRKQVFLTLHRLAARGLAIQNGRDWSAVKPSESQSQWFLPRSCKTPKHWTDNIAYWPVEATHKPLESVLIGMVRYHKGLKHTTATGIATRLGVAQGTISKLLATTTALTRVVTQWNTGLHPKTKQKTALRFDVDLVEALAPQPEVKAEASIAQQCEPLENWRDIQNDLKRQGIPTFLAMQITDAFKKFSFDDWNVFLSRYWAICEDAQQSHQKNFEAGKVNVKHHGFLLEELANKYATSDIESRRHEAELYDELYLENVH